MYVRSVMMMVLIMAVTAIASSGTGSMPLDGSDRIKEAAYVPPAPMSNAEILAFLQRETGWRPIGFSFEEYQDCSGNTVWVILGANLSSCGSCNGHNTYTPNAYFDAVPECDTCDVSLQSSSFLPCLWRCLDESGNCQAKFFFDLEAVCDWADVHPCTLFE